MYCRIEDLGCMISFEVRYFRHKTKRRVFHVFFLNWFVKPNDLECLFSMGRKKSQPHHVKNLSLFGPN